MRISDGSSDVCSSYLVGLRDIANAIGAKLGVPTRSITNEEVNAYLGAMGDLVTHDMPASSEWTRTRLDWEPQGPTLIDDIREMNIGKVVTRSKEHTTELQSLMRISYAVFCLKKKKYKNENEHK